MSYRLDLDEQTDESLLKELASRAQLHSEGKCTYCKRSHKSTPVCKLPDRHEGKLSSSVETVFKFAKPFLKNFLGK